ncbi:hypothetical protein [Dysgonomonas sp. 520]|uniref:hypothetical protein n=1 Tax=Dysgonomonas sp. 520 TaxID=2302931 RepID=UPI0013D685DA|nr:hypothetical protein [Dysgonomonas sp. 520]NDW10677.1 hypothetical protein [Dysgonomonas sp. 520]
MINILFTIFIYTVINAVAITLAWLLTENIGTRIADLHPILDRKPFNCKPCTTFWLTLLGQSIIAYIIGSWLWLALGVVTAFVIFFNINYQDKKQIED